MKKILFCLTAFVWSTTLCAVTKNAAVVQDTAPVASEASDSGVYLGLGYGVGGGSSSHTINDQTNFSGGAVQSLFGYQFNQYYALELGTLFSSGFNNNNQNTHAFSFPTFDCDYMNYLALKMMLPLNVNWNAFVKLGVAAVNGFRFFDFSSDNTSSNGAGYGALGLGYTINPNWRMSFAVGSTIGGKPINMWSVMAAMEYHFSNH